MKTIVAGILVVLSVGSQANAAPAMPLPAPAIAAPYTCEGRALSHVALRAEPAPCCTGMLGCPQLLANTGLVKPKPANRT